MHVYLYKQRLLFPSWFLPRSCRLNAALDMLGWFLKRKGEGRKVGEETQNSCGHLSHSQRNLTRHFPWCLPSENTRCLFLPRCSFSFCLSSALGIRPGALYLLCPLVSFYFFKYKFQEGLAKWLRQTISCDPPVSAL